MLYSRRLGEPETSKPKACEEFELGQNRKVYIEGKIYLTLGDIMEIALTKMSSKGQIVIPSELREDIKEGDQLIIIKNDHQLILKKAREMDKNLKEDLEFAKRTEAAWERYEKGEFKTNTAKDFLKDLEKW